MDKRTCSIDGCGKPVLARGWCGAHYRRWRIHGEPGGAELIRKPAGSVACGVEGCTGFARVYGLCGKHYQRLDRLNSTELPDHGARKCDVEGCGRTAESRGWCSMHYKRWQAHGDPEATLHTETCSVEGCERKHSGRGLCATHYARWKAGTPLDAPLQVNNKGKACSIAGCEKPAEKLGWCIMHHARWRKHGDVNAAKLDRTPSPDGMCVICHTEPVAPDSVRYCSVRCKGRADRARQPKPPVEVLICIDCNDLFERPSRLGDPPQRCEPCRDAHKKRWNAEWSSEWQKRYPEKVRAREAQRRAQKLCLPYEVFEDLEIFKRDQWICGLCAEPVDKTLRWPDPFSPSLDHILPLSRGGHHTRENCQLSHLRCNLRKNNRIPA